MCNNYNCGDSRCQPIDITPPVYLTRIIVPDRTLKLKGEPMNETLHLQNYKSYQWQILYWKTLIPKH